MDYSKMSDGEINRHVAIALGVKPRKTICFIRYEDSEDIWPEYCNNPADAWPIILSNRISMLWDCSEDANSEWWNAVDQFDECRIQYQSNPLRAAMIVFLMMQEAK